MALRIRRSSDGGSAVEDALAFAASLWDPDAEYCPRSPDADEEMLEADLEPEAEMMHEDDLEGLVGYGNRTTLDVAVANHEMAPRLLEAAGFKCLHRFWRCCSAAFKTAWFPDSEPAWRRGPPGLGDLEVGKELLRRNFAIFDTHASEEFLRFMIAGRTTPSGMEIQRALDSGTAWGREGAMRYQVGKHLVQLAQEGGQNLTQMNCRTWETGFIVNRVPNEDGAPYVQKTRSEACPTSTARSCVLCLVHFTSRNGSTGFGFDRRYYMLNRCLVCRQR